MLPALLRDLFEMQLFGYISFRTTMACLTAFALVLWLGGPTIAWLRKARCHEDVSKTDSPELAAKNKETGKAGTTTMGGSFLIAGLLGSVVLWCRLDNVHVILAVVLTAGFAAVGFVDDFKKLTIQGSKGLSPKAKMVGLSLVTAFVLGSFVWYAETSERHALLTLYPPLFKNVAFSL
ncbi:MAG TPA: phospho-N-acetylmuramoyl-pentapeptide-transferase, partial [Planctomycetota bacterium]|nr:phospho-N-acetylmuramoyl-pentapeptide-transferase [Planctomycetota bacterium]